MSVRPVNRAGLYRVVHHPSGRTLLGSGVNVDALLNRVRFELHTGSHRRPALQRDWNADGAGAFTFEVLDILPPPPAGAPAGTLHDDLEELLTLWQESLKLPAASRY